MHLDIAHTLLAHLLNIAGKRDGRRTGILAVRKEAQEPPRAACEVMAKKGMLPVISVTSQRSFAAKPIEEVVRAQFERDPHVLGEIENRKRTGGVERI